jgi:peptidoglycan-N-acetylglucosamine deacetylase
LLPLHWITALYLVLAGAVFALPVESRTIVWGTLLVTYFLMCLGGSTVLTNRLLGPCLTRGTKGDGIALTYDDGPGAIGTPELLDLLAARGVKANFFCIGKHVVEHPEILRRAHREGHLIGNHSYRHTPVLQFQTLKRLRADMRECQDAIATVTGAAPAFYRPPYGLRNHATHYAARDNGVRVVGWSAGGLDTTRRTIDTIVAMIFRDLAPGAIVLLHDRGPDPARTLEITRRILDEMDARGLHAARLDEIV